MYQSNPCGVSCAKQFALTRVMAVDEIDWVSVAQILTKYQGLSPSAAKKEIAKLLDPFGALYELSWFQGERQSDSLQHLISAICEIHSLDGVILRKQQEIPIFDLASFRYTETLNLAAKSDSLEGPFIRERLIPTISLGLGRYELKIANAWKAALVRLGVCLLVALLYVPALALILLGAAALAAAVDQPAQTLEVLSNNWLWGASALLGAILIVFLVFRGVLALFRKLI